MMMPNLFLEDLKGLDEIKVKLHIAEEYSEDGTDKTAITKSLEEHNVIIAYESVGSWGCDSSSWFLLQHKGTGVYQEFSGSHCSCYGFEGQFDLQEATLDYLKSNRFAFYCGGYDSDETENQKVVKDFIDAL